MTGLNLLLLKSNFTTALYVGALPTSESQGIYRNWVENDKKFLNFSLYNLANEEIQQKIK